MNNYHYIIAGLPELLPDFPARQFSYGDTAAAIREQLSKADRKKVDWLEYGFEPANLSHYFYHALKKQKSKLLQEYFLLDKAIRNASVKYISAQEGKEDGIKYILSPEEPSELFDEVRVNSIFKIPNLIERELEMDRYRWEKINSLIQWHYFDMEVILAFLAKGLIVRRWLALDPDNGSMLFRTYVDEIRGTFNRYANNQEY